jgi:hypothetical protein
MSESDYVVVRRAPDLPAAFNTGDLDGKWFDRATLPIRTEDPEDRAERFRKSGGTASSAVAVPTGRFEVRDDGAVAEVYEIRV